MALFTYLKWNNVFFFKVKYASHPRFNRAKQKVLFLAINENGREITKRVIAGERFRESGDFFPNFHNIYHSKLFTRGCLVEAISWQGLSSIKVKLQLPLCEIGPCLTPIFCSKLVLLHGCYYWPWQYHNGLGKPTRTDLRPSRKPLRSS